MQSFQNVRVASQPNHTTMKIAGKDTTLLKFKVGVPVIDEATGDVVKELDPNNVGMMRTKEVWYNVQITDAAEVARVWEEIDLNTHDVIDLEGVPSETKFTGTDGTRKINRTIDKAVVGQVVSRATQGVKLTGKSFTDAEFMEVSAAEAEAEVDTSRW